MVCLVSTDYHITDDSRDAIMLGASGLYHAELCSTFLIYIILMTMYSLSAPCASAGVPSLSLGSGCRCVRAGESTVVGGKYIHWADLREMDTRRPVRQPTVPPELGVVATPLVASVWEAELESHPDGEFAAFLVEGIRRGFRIGYDYNKQVGTGGVRNMHSARVHPEPIDRYVQEEMGLGRILRLPDGAMGRQEVHVSRFGVIPSLISPANGG